MKYVLRYELTPPQKLFIQSEKTNRIFSGGIGSGKTFAGAIAALNTPPSTGMVISPTNDMADIPFRAVVDVADQIIEKKILSKGSRYLKLTTGHEMYFRSADRPDRLRGPNLGWIWIDEAGQLPDESVWNIALGRLRLHPGRAWITTTPNGFNWLYHLIQNSDPSTLESIKASSRSNTFIKNKSFINLVESTYDEQFARQELEGEYVSLDSVLFKREYVIIENVKNKERLQIAAGVDLAISQKESAAYTAIVVMGRDPKTGVIYVMYVERFRAEFHDILKRIELVAQKFLPFVISIENVQFQTAVIQELKRTTKLNINSVSADKDKVTRFRPLLAQYEKMNVRHGDNLPDYYLDELQVFPDGKYKDCVDAASYAYLSLTSSMTYQYISTKQRDSR